jgi:hypothetical protein
VVKNEKQNIIAFMDEVKALKEETNNKIFSDIQKLYKRAEIEVIKPKTISDDYKSIKTTLYGKPIEYIEEFVASKNEYDAGTKLSIKYDNDLIFKHDISLLSTVLKIRQNNEYIHLLIMESLGSAATYVVNFVLQQGDIIKISESIAEWYSLFNDNYIEDVLLKNIFINDDGEILIAIKSTYKYGFAGSNPEVTEVLVPIIYVLENRGSCSWNSFCYGSIKIVNNDEKLAEIYKKASTSFDSQYTKLKMEFFKEDGEAKVEIDKYTYDEGSSLYRFPNLIENMEIYSKSLVDLSVIENIYLKKP